MTLLKINDYTFHIDTDKTKEYYSSHSVCECSCCRNLYAQIRNFSPQLDNFLSQFGVDVCRPDEVPSTEGENHIDYLFIGYTVTGTMDTDRLFEIDLDNLHITISNGINPFEWFPHEQKDPCFFISVSGVSLPWELDEPFPNTHPFKEKLLDRIKRFINK